MANLLNDYTKLTYQDILEDFQTRVDNDPRFKNLSKASAFRLLMEMFASSIDMTNYYIQRTAEESTLDQCKLLSSAIKLGHNLGYNPTRNTPAQAEIKIRLRGPLPASLRAGATVYFSQQDTDLSFNGRKYNLWTDYSYTFTDSDIIAGKSATWEKELIWSKKVDENNARTIDGEKIYTMADVSPIKIFQGEFKIETIPGYNNQVKLGKNYQIYDINDVNFSNWYGKRDPVGYRKGVLKPKNSYTQVGIGLNEIEAFDADNLFEIEDQAIHLNPNVIKYKNSTEENEHEEINPLKVCCITTNSDKTVRIQFGDGKITKCGLMNKDENIYIKYISCEGSLANTVGTTDAIMTINNSFYGSQTGSPAIDLTNNIQIVINSDISNGVDFESIESIKINAPFWYASCFGKLISKNDFISYFRTLTVPIKVKNAIAWGQDEIEKLSNYNSSEDEELFHVNNTNLICYSITSDPYKIDNYNNSFYNILTEENNFKNVISLYGTGEKYVKSLLDYSKLITDYETLSAEQYNVNPEEQYQKNIKIIRENIEDKMPLGTKIFSMPPIVHYFDVVGTITVDSLSKMQEIKLETENKIYKWLNDNCNFNQPIYKSDIIKFFMNNKNVSNTNLDIKISNIEINTTDFDIFEFDKDNFELSSDTYYEPTNNNKNILTLTIDESKGINFDEETFRGKKIILTLKSNKNRTEEIEQKIIVPKEVEKTDDKIILTFGESFFGSGKTYNNIELKVSKIDDFASKGQPLKYIPDDNTDSNLFENKDNLNNEEKIYKLFFKWLEEVNNNVRRDTVTRPINLPYTISINGNNKTNNTTNDYTLVTRQETYERRGNIQTLSLEKELTERSFWNYFVPKVIEYFKDVEETDDGLDEETWKDINDTIYNIYTQIKGILSDSILDENNNITNYSLNNEIPIIRLNILYNYKS